MRSLELKSIDEAGIEVREERREQERHDRDNRELRRLGKKPVLRRNFGFLSMLGFGSTVMATWEGVLLLLAVNFTNGGFAGSVYGYMFVWAGVAASFATMAELASMAPTAGGQYHWVSILAPQRSRIFLSYTIGWLTMIGWQAIVASGGFLCASLIQGLLVLRDPAYAPQAWQTMLLYWTAILFAILVNTLVGRLLPKIEGLILILHLFGFVGIFIPLLYFAPHGSAQQVFTEFDNGGMWPSQGVSFLIGALGPAYSLLGPDGAVHMSEEISSPATNVPYAIVYGILLNGMLGFGMLLAALFSVGDVATAFATPTGFPFMAIFQSAVVDLNGALALSSIVVLLMICASISFVATASRMTWSFARDRGTPFWKFFSQVEPRTTLPLRAIFLTMMISVLLSLISLGSAVAFNDVVSLAINGLYTSYLIGNSLLLWRRATGCITPYVADSATLTNTVGAQALSWGPWRIPEPFGTINNAFGCCYMLVVLFFSFWPVSNDPNAASMNYSSLMIGSVIIFSMFYYAFRAQRVYTGPVVETNLDSR